QVDVCLVALYRFVVCLRCESLFTVFFFFQAEDGIRDLYVTGVQTCALPISLAFDAGDMASAQLLGERALAAYAHGSALSRIAREIGRASCRERVVIPVVGVSFKKK